jgi:hypothetical protein
LVEGAWANPLAHAPDCTPSADIQTRRNIMKKIKQHYSNARNWGDSWYFITKMMLQGHLLTDEKYEQALKNLFTVEEK